MHVCLLALVFAEMLLTRRARGLVHSEMGSVYSNIILLFQYPIIAYNNLSHKVLDMLRAGEGLIQLLDIFLFFMISHDGCFVFSVVIGHLCIIVVTS